MRNPPVRRLTLLTVLLFAVLGLLGQHLEDLDAWSTLGPELGQRARTLGLAGFHAARQAFQAPSMWIFVGATALCLIGVAIVSLRAMSRDRQTVAVRLARSGQPVAVIARRLGCGQDAVRGMLRP
jgi:hypothetical protein